MAYGTPQWPRQSLQHGSISRRSTTTYDDAAIADTSLLYLPHATHVLSYSTNEHGGGISRLLYNEKGRLFSLSFFDADGGNATYGSGISRLLCNEHEHEHGRVISWFLCDDANADDGGDQSRSRI